MSTQETVQKFEKIFEIYPWLLDSKNIIHFPFFVDPHDSKNKEQLQGISWKEIGELIRSKF